MAAGGCQPGKAGGHGGGSAGGTLWGQGGGKARGQDRDHGQGPGHGPADGPVLPQQERRPAADQLLPGAALSDVPGGRRDGGRPGRCGLCPESA